MMTTVGEINGDAAGVDAIAASGGWRESAPARRAWLRAVTGLTGAALLYAVASAFPAFALAAWASPGLLLISVRGMRPASAFLCGVLFAVLAGCGLAGRDLVAVPPYFEGNPMLPAGMVMACFMVAAGVPYGLLTLAYARAAGRMPSVARSSLAAWLWVGAELGRAALSMPLWWELLGETQFRNQALMQISDLGGVYAVSFIVVLASVAGAELLADLSVQPLDLRGIARRVAIPALAVVTVLVYGLSSQRLQDSAADRYVLRNAIARGLEIGRFGPMPRAGAHRPPGVRI